MSSNAQWQGSLADLPSIISSIKRLRAFGRLTVRNNTRLGLAHLYFRNGRLVHVIGTRGAVDAVLADLQSWTRATLRFERGVMVQSENVTPAHEQRFERWLSHLQARYSSGTVPRSGPAPTTATPPPVAQPRPQIVEGQVVARTKVNQLISPWEWQLLVEATRRVSLAVAQLVGPKEAMNVLRDIIDDCSAAFPAFSGLKISPNGYLYVMDKSHLDRMPREDLLEGFSALIAICQYFCSPIVGEVEAHKLIIRALGDIAPALVSLGVFQVDNRLLLNGG
ncbi:DUF4388 domain-containing protein [Thermogemmatispora sp.]|uniref:DUF4388 domain-containing protein n=1 Tax=Thermogemmatispora sp. TaxID=1968838 RepID=UPI001DD5552C|nr:DUF4388 domain-containing protein [Thermogemmatispora sp.]MBX5452082.1 DUF4388 domain-containing protein [Thermogemmatispora sp.]